MTRETAGRTSASTRSTWAECEAAFDAPMLTREDASQGNGEQRLVSWFG